MADNDEVKEAPKPPAKEAPKPKKPKQLKVELLAQVRTLDKEGNRVSHLPGTPEKPAFLTLPEAEARALADLTPPAVKIEGEDDDED